MPPDNSPPDTLLNVQQLAERLRVSVSLAYRLLADGKFTVVRVGTGRGAIRIPEPEIDRYLGENEQ
jgi:excisionase family DNA binding protein